VPDRPDAELAGCRAAHARLLATLDGLSDDAARAPSRLPGWSVGHVLTHLARNADSHAAMFAAAGRGEVVDQYPGGREQRAADIEAGAGRDAAELVADVAAAAARLEAAWAATTDAVWRDGAGRTGGFVRLPELVVHRWREVEVHHADLGLGYTWADWPPDYVRRDLARQAMRWRAAAPMGQGELPAASLALAPAKRLAWLMGRIDVDGLPAVHYP
jgi:maleylpyruvate isomerase